jgi:hypothetical protein
MNCRGGEGRFQFFPDLSSTSFRKILFRDVRIIGGLNCSRLPSPRTWELDIRGSSLPMILVCGLEDCEKLQGGVYRHDLSCSSNTRTTTVIDIITAGSRLTVVQIDRNVYIAVGITVSAVSILLAVVTWWCGCRRHRKPVGMVRVGRYIRFFADDEVLYDEAGRRVQPFIVDGRDSFRYTPYRVFFFCSCYQHSRGVINFF